MAARWQTSVSLDSGDSEAQALLELPAKAGVTFGQSQEGPGGQREA